MKNKTDGGCAITIENVGNKILGQGNSFWTQIYNRNLPTSACA